MGRECGAAKIAGRRTWLNILGFPRPEALARL
jgi:hypothetical protein